MSKSKIKKTARLMRDNPESTIEALSDEVVRRIKQDKEMISALKEAAKIIKVLTGENEFLDAKLMESESTVRELREALCRAMDWVDDSAGVREIEAILAKHPEVKP